MIIQVLDKGFVRLEGFLGGDEAVVRSARVSYDSIAGDSEKDKKLIAYLLANNHGSPFEHSVFQFHVKLPVFVARQWIRHRMACLGGDTLLEFDGRQKQGFTFSRYTKSVSEVYNAFQSTFNKHRPDKQGNPFYRREQIKKMKLRCLNEKTSSINHTTIEDITFSGVQKLYRITTENGKIFQATMSHRCLTNKGWLPLSKIIKTRNILLQTLCMKGNPGKQIPIKFNKDEEWKTINGCLGAYDVSTYGRVRSWISTRRKRLAQPHIKVHGPWKSGQRPVVGIVQYGNSRIENPGGYVLETFVGKRPSGRHEVCHKNGNTLDSRLSNVYWGTPKENRNDCRKADGLYRLRPVYSKIEKIEYLGKRNTYDIAVAGPWHNFSAGGAIVHNSYNEVSARYTEAKDEFYFPSKWRAQDTKNKQGSVEAELNHEHMTKRLETDCQWAMKAYNWYLEKGAAKEMARFVLPVNLYTQWYWTVNARALLHFLELRCDNHAQWETRQYAHAIALIMREYMPWTFEAWIHSIPENKKSGYEEMHQRLRDLTVEYSKELAAIPTTYIQNTKSEVTP